jgi:two-component system, NtrC family, response regulator AtoC
LSRTILYVDDEENSRIFVCEYLTGQGYEVIGVSTLNEARQILHRGSADIVVLDVQLPDGYGPILLTETERLPVRPPIIIITAYGDIDSAVAAMKNGAFDFIQKPIDLPQLEKSIQRAVEIVAMRQELNHLRQSQHEGADFVVGSTAKMKRVLDEARRAAEASVSVLITGETGTGKDMLALAIHKMGSRANKTLMPINCSAIQSTVLESELFGYEPGAFTGADKRKLGLMEVADDGILFLDEISSMPIDMQAKLLRAIEEKAFRRVGGTNTIHVDVQVIAASNRSLPKLIESGAFREDLYYRLKVLDLHLPPLRERMDDIPELVGLFIRKNNQRHGLNVTDITPIAMDVLMGYKWPGNIRELRNVIERAMLFCDDASIDVQHFPSDLLESRDYSR